MSRRSISTGVVNKLAASEFSLYWTANAGNCDGRVYARIRRGPDELYCGGTTYHFSRWGEDEGFWVWATMRGRWGDYVLRPSETLACF